jgi:hypothetical protein
MSSETFVTPAGARRFILAAFFFIAAAPAMSDEPHYCQSLIETASKEDLVQHCRPGDTLILQIVPEVAPGPIVGKLCDLEYEIWAEKKDQQVTVVCQYVKKKVSARAWSPSNGMLEIR